MNRTWVLAAALLTGGCIGDFGGGVPPGGIVTDVCLDQFGAASDTIRLMCPVGTPAWPDTRCLYDLYPTTDGSFGVANWRDVGIDPVSVLVDEGTSVEVPVTVFSNTAVPVILTGGVQATVANCRSFPLCPASQVLSFQIHNPQIAASCP